MRTDSVLLSLNREIAKRAKRAKIFIRVTLKTYVIIKNNKEKIKTVGVVDRIGDNIHCVESTWTARWNSQTLLR